MPPPYDAKTPAVQSSAPRIALWAAYLVAFVASCGDFGRDPAGAQPQTIPEAAPTDDPVLVEPPAAAAPIIPGTSGVVVFSGPPPELLSCFLPTPVHHPEWVRARNLVYSHVDGQDLALDVFRAPGDEPKPAIVLLHGGGWRRGERGHMNEPARAFARLGYAAVPVSYRLLNGGLARFPAAVNDVRCAVRYLRVHADELGIDPDRIGVVGGSAGAHLAAMLATASDVPELEPQCPIPVSEGSAAVQVAASFYGPHDLNQRFGPGGSALIGLFLGPPNSAERRAQASPITHVDPTDPPLLLVHGGRDAVVPIAQSRLMYARLLEAGVPTQLVEIREAVHGFPIFREGRHPRASCTTLHFLAHYLHPVTPPPHAPSRSRIRPPVVESP